MYKDKINKNVYTYMYAEGNGCYEYCTIFYDKKNDVYCVVPDSQYYEFKHTHDIDNYYLVMQPDYFKEL